MLVPLVTAPDASRSTPAPAAPPAGSRPEAGPAPAPEPGGMQAFDAVLAVATDLLDCHVAMLWVSEASRLRLVASRGLTGSGEGVDSVLGTLVDADNPRAFVADASQDPRLREDALVAGPAGLRRFVAAALFGPGGELLGVLGVGDSRPGDAGTADGPARIAPLATLAARVFEGAALARCRQAAESGPSAIVVVDPAGSTIFANAAARDLFGPAAMPGQPLDRLIPLSLQREPEQTARWLHGDGKTRHEVPSARELRLRDAAGELRTVEAVRCDWHDGGARGVALVLRDITEPGATTRESRALRRDALTGLSTREALFATIDSLRSRGARLGVALLALDNFRAVNEALGHVVGDTVLQVVACRLMAWLPADAHLARFGGDEFAILFEAPNGVDAFESRLQALLRDVARPCEIDHQRVHVEACIGLAADGAEVSAHGDHGSSGLLALASLALHHAKRAGSLQIRRFSPSMRAEAIDRRHLDLELRRAFRDGEFELHYQPQIDLGTGLPSGAEALLRWRHPERGLLMPVAFIDALARSAIAPAVGNWILQQACRDAASWQPVDGRGLKVGVNLFPAQFNDDALVDKVDAALAASGLAPAQLEIELTETIALREDGVAEKTLARLRQRGIRVSYDDFGTGHASLSMLHRLPVDRVKIDRSFVRDLVASRGDKAIVRSITLIAKNFDMEVIAEGVESDEQVTLLREFGCQEVQGFLYSKALPRPVFDHGRAARTASSDAQPAHAVEPSHG